METPKSPDGIRHSRGVVIRNTTTQLRDTTRKTFMDWIPFGEWHEHPLECRLRFDDVDCEVLFRALDRPQDVRNLLSLDLTFAYCNEGRELAKPVFDGLTARVGRFPRRQDVPEYWSGIWMDSNPWHDGHWLDKLERVVKDPNHRFFWQPGGRDPKAENLKNLKPGYYQGLLAGKDSEWVRVYVDGLRGTSDRGSIYGEWLDALAARSSLWGEFTDGVFTSWDLGLADATSIWWWRLAGGGVELLDFYENTGKGLGHYFEQLDQRARPVSKGGFGWGYVKHWLPHDANHKTLATQVSVLNQFHQRYGSALTAIGPDLTVRDGLAAGRWLLEQPDTRFHPRCSVVRPGTEFSGMDLLRAYRFAWDERNQVYGKNPLHDFASHAADGYRYVAVVARASLDLTTRPSADTVEPLAVIDGRTNLTLETLLQQNDAWQRKQERRRR